MASVWIARLTGKHGFEKLVAIKTILPEFASDDRFRLMFLDEARIASRIEHTHVAQILDLGEQHDILYLVMEYVDGDSLSRLFKTLGRTNQKLPQNVLLRVVADVCGGLHAAHELAAPDGRPLGVVHRDVSPQNILISTLGVAKLIDFGIAKARDRLGEDTNAGLFKGKIHYMAPEQAIGSDVDRRTDVFAVGAILYHLLSGKPPFQGDSPRAVMHRLASLEPPDPLPANVPAPIAAVVRRALAHSRADRFSNAAELQTALESAMVETKLSCTPAEVARVVKTHMAERTTKRKEAIDLAIAAAAERVRMRQLLRPPASEASMIESAASSGPVGLAPQELDALRALTSSSPGTPSIPLETAIPVEIDPPRPKRRWALVLGVGAVAAAAIVTTLVIQSHARHGQVESTVVHAASPPPAASSSTAAATASAATDAPRVSAIATVDIDSLPKVNTAGNSATKPAVTAVAAPVRTNTSTTNGSTKRHRVNDGF